MLKRLELWGFKSFADKTVFEFGPGITAIVGPNGSGKSNIVDAIRWVLGEQSAKSLRGKEMADCIFNGSGTRKQLGFAEVTVTVDNSRRYLRFDGEEVAITRRVYRTGESQYFINRKPARLRDIRDLLMGTGTSSQTYSIIEQGRVDALLQASNKERRLIFEEAAGIRAFKAKKQEALARLEKVEQNLARLEDVLDEVKRRLKTVRSQASKAREYSELARRLRELRIKVGAVEYTRLQAECRELETTLSEHATAYERANVRLEVLRTAQLELDQLLEGLERETRHAEAEYSDIRQEIARWEASVRHGRQRYGELQEELAHTRNRWRELVKRCQELARRVHELEQKFDLECRSLDEHHQALQSKEEALASIERELERAEQSIADLKKRRLELEQQRVDLRNRASALESQARTMQAQRSRYEARRHGVESQLSEILAELESLKAEDDRIKAEKAGLAQQLADLSRRRSELSAELSELNVRLSQLSAQKAAIDRELSVYLRLDEEGEGMSAGALQILGIPELQQVVLGLLVDQFQTDRTIAPLVDRVLGSLTSAVLVTSISEAVAQLEKLGVALNGPVTLLEASEPAEAPSSAAPSLPGVVRLLDLLDVAPPARGALTAVLGNVWVADGEQALLLARRELPTARLITREGTLYEPFGAVTIGRSKESSGLVSRRAIVRDLRGETERIDGELQRVSEQLREREQEIEQIEGDCAKLDEKIRELNQLLQNNERELAGREQQANSLKEELELLRQEDELLLAELQRIDKEISEIQNQLEALDEQSRELEESARLLDSAYEAIKARKEQCREEIARHRVLLAQEEERRRSLEREVAAARDELADRERARQQVWSQILQVGVMLREAERGVLRATTRLAHLYDRKDRVSRQIVELLERREAARSERATIADEVDRIRAESDERQQKVHEVELKLHDARRSLQELVDKLLEDYQVDLHAVADRVQIEPDFDVSEASAEARRLKRRIQSLGPVNVDAVSELEELEERERTLEEQRADLLEAKQSLIAIIDRINDDSKRLFTQTLDEIRTHFQELFRKLFGGGKADIVLDDPDDVLESGVEIIAKPPGKELRSISLLSGGEKTLTVVALLLAIFRSRPSPFCILDEVDAALDEANIDRFTAVLREFTDRSQFILITHSKKTMLQADVLYGITMQESGVSKRISVRIEDVNEQGEIRAEAIARESESQMEQHEAA